MNTVLSWFGLTQADRREQLGIWPAFAAMMGVSLSMMLSSLDQTIVGNALPTMVAELNGFDLYAWVATSYMLCSMIAIPVFGRLGDYFGRKPFILAAIFTFTAASVVCAMVDSMWGLVLGRALQGIGGGMIIGSAFACIPELFPDTRRRLRWQIMLSTISSVANATGPVLGGVLTDQFGWRSIFLINVPLGALALFWACRFIPFYRPSHGRKIRVDWTGAALVVIFLVALQTFVDLMPLGRHGQLAAVGALTLAAGVLLYRCEKRATDALLPPRLFLETESLRRLFCLAILAGALMYVLLFYLPLLFQGGYGYSPREAGILVTPLALLMTIGAIVNGRIVIRLRHPNLLLFFGLGALTLSTAGFAIAGPHASFGHLLGLAILGGMGLGFSMLNLTLFTQSLSPHEFLGIATAMQKSLRLVGGMIGAAVMATLLSWLYSAQVAHDFAILNQPEAAAYFSNPQSLIPGADHALGRYSTETVELARAALRRSLSVGLFIMTGVGAWALYMLRKVPAIKLG